MSVQSQRAAAAQMRLAGYSDEEIANIVGFDTAEDAHKAHQEFFHGATGIDYDVVHAKTQGEQS